MLSDGWMYGCMDVYMYLCTFVSMHGWMDGCMYVYRYFCIYVGICVSCRYLCIRVGMYIFDLKCILLLLI